MGLGLARVCVAEPFLFDGMFAIAKNSVSLAFHLVNNLMYCRINLSFIANNIVYQISN